MRLTALVESPTHVCCRYRLSAFQPALARAGHTLDLASLPRQWWSRIRVFQSLRGKDVILQRTLLPRWQLAVLRHAVRTLLFDFDDAVFLRDSYASRGLHHARRLQRFIATIQVSDAVIAGNAFLRDRATHWIDDSRVHVIPTCVTPGSYSLATHARHKAGVQLVWVGSSSTLQGLERTAPLWEQLGKEIPGLLFKIICDREWVHAVATLARDPELRRRMGQTCRRRVEDGFSVELGATRWLELLERLRPLATRAG